MLPSLLANRKRQLLLASLVVVGVAQSLALISLIWLAKQVVAFDAAITTKDIIWVGLFGIGLLAICRFFERYCAEIMAQSYVKELRQQVFKQTTELSTRARNQFQGSHIMLRLTGDLTAIRNWYVQGVAPLVVLSTWLIIAMIGLLLVSEWLFAAVVVILSLAVYGNYIIGRQLYNKSLPIRRNRGYMIRNVTELLAQLRLVQLFNQQKREQRRFERQSSRLVDAQLDRAKISGALRGFNELLLGLAVLALLLIGIELINQQQLTPENLALTMAAGLYLLAHMRRLSRLYELWTLKKVAVDKINQFLNKEKLSNKRKKTLSPPLSFQFQQFRCPARFPPLTASFEAGSRVAIYGSHGCGKSSLLLGMLAELETKGRYRINDISYKKIKPTTLSRLITLVSPELPLLRGSVKKNLFYGARNLDDGYTEQVLALCGVSKWLESNPEGIGFSLAESGRNVATSQRYRLQMARALLRRPQLLLIDSDESHQDPTIQEMLLNLLGFFDGAILICTQLPELQRQCDQHWRVTENSVDVELINVASKISATERNEEKDEAKNNGKVTRMHSHG